MVLFFLSENSFICGNNSNSFEDPCRNINWLYGITKIDWSCWPPLFDVVNPTCQVISVVNIHCYIQFPLNTEQGISNNEHRRTSDRNFPCSHPQKPQR